MNIQPLHDRIVVEAAAKESKSAGGIILPDSAQEKPLSGRVLAVGPGKTLDSGTIAKPEVKKGDTVMYGKYAGTEVTVSGKDYVILRGDDILGIVTSDKAAVSMKSAPKPAKKVAPKAKQAAPKGKKKSKAGAR
jgi:chaperonin GroES